MTGKPSLTTAYDLTGPKENTRLYREWAPTYDSAFAKAKGYLLPKTVAQLFIEAYKPHDLPVLDVGAGTGLVGEALSKGGVTSIEAVDISQEMLEIAREKRIYGARHCVDLTAPRSFGLGHYGGLVSAGTFTHGHLGPEILPHMIAMGKPGALFVISINAGHYQSRGFSAAFSGMKSRIQKPELIEVPIYENADTETQGNDTALIARFRSK